MASSGKSLALPILVITVGIGWLLTARNVIPGVNWIWILGLAVVGVLILVLGGLNRVTVVAGPFLIITTLFSLLRQTGHLDENTEVPCLVIVGGVLLFISRLLPLPDWAAEPPPGKK